MTVRGTSRIASSGVTVRPSDRESWLEKASTRALKMVAFSVARWTDMRPESTSWETSCVVTRSADASRSRRSCTIWFRSVSSSRSPDC